MIKNIIKIGMTLLGIAILVDGIITEIDGIGRFAMILFGVIFCLAGSFMSFHKNEK